ncbi:ABC transporter substrate-binding protein [Streptomyces sp. SRF1]|uniref:ABC transporter substrate-binding protein n=1 Tax=Streptomyces sp. SRF1 TaxID=1549642 RepID=UPI0025AF6483|nr:ABC transporter substrate-binding protein [Streptomyces sp. SRF1]MDN3057157.1 ABC transporter substrate-binding protein [Streptomyces sp. SRF1]
MRRITLGVCGTVAATLVLSACGSGPSPDTTASGHTLRAMLPEHIRAAGVLKVGGSATVAPYLFYKGGGPAGMEKDLMNALGEALGVRVHLSDIDFAGLVPALQSQRIDVAMSDFTDSAERRQSVDFVDYTTSYSTLLVRGGNPGKLHSRDDLCGGSVAATVGSTSQKLAEEQDTVCTDGGRKGIQVLRMENNPSTWTQVHTGRADAMLIDFLIGQYVADQGQGEVVGATFHKQFHGAAVRKDDTRLRKALVAAFTQVMKDGTYIRILRKWKAERLAMSQPIVNASAS